MRSADHGPDISTGNMTRRRKRKIFAVLGAPLIALLLVTAECAAATAGFVKVAEGTATVTRGSQTMPAAPGLALEEGDVLKMVRGVAAYVSGKIAQLSPDAVRVETPVATVGVRGTRFVAKVPVP